MADYKKLSEGERLNLVQNAILNGVNMLLDMFPGYRGYRRGVENLVNMAQGKPSNYSTADYARDLGYSMVPFYGAYDNAINGRPQDWKGNAIEAVLVGLPIKKGRFPTTDWEATQVTNKALRERGLNNLAEERPLMYSEMYDLPDVPNRERVIINEGDGLNLQSRHNIDDLAERSNEILEEGLDEARKYNYNYSDIAEMLQERYPQIDYDWSIDEARPPVHATVGEVEALDDFTRKYMETKGKYGKEAADIIFDPNLDETQKAIRLKAFLDEYDFKEILDGI